ncbi:uncharacterized protein LOC132808874 [Hemiscyllium ocellatum]|uniref:uncharacterized protein LOC132808874 n=1 Tax=Hemiscyllium ocellatum TaxID=170820 RepID=UPI002965FC49|nr:uncharacterized protein LOC132808874 [Hemiscyllium ocellatum]
MAAAYLTGLSRLAGVAGSCASGVPGLSLWSGLMGFRLLALVIADRPWGSGPPQLLCNLSSSSSAPLEFCANSCYNHHFRFPLDLFWHLSFLLALLPVFWLYLLAPRPRPGLAPDGLSGGGGLSLEEASGRAQAPSPSRRSRPWPSIACGLALLGLESAFLGVLLKVQLPLVLPTSIRCTAPAGGACVGAGGGTLTCILTARSDKVGALYVMAFSSLLNMAVSLGYIASTCLAPRSCCLT